jgi:hypothetical protein
MSNYGLGWQKDRAEGNIPVGHDNEERADADQGDGEAFLCYEWAHQFPGVVSENRRMRQSSKKISVMD